MPLLSACVFAPLRFALPGVYPNTSATRERVVRWIHLLALRACMFSWVAGLGERDRVVTVNFGRAVTTIGRTRVAAGGRLGDLALDSRAIRRVGRRCSLLPCILLTP